MKILRFVSTALAGISLCANPTSMEHVAAQPVAVTLPTEFEKRSELSERFAPIMNSGNAVSSDMSAEMRQWETILNRVWPQRFLGSRRLDNCLAELRQLGLPIVLDNSAADDAATPDQPIQLPLPDRPLWSRLQHGLKEINATVVFQHGLIRVVSLDVAGDTEFLMRVTYDVTNVGTKKASSIIDVINTSIGYDTWADSGTGEATIQAIVINGRKLLVISQLYEKHREIRELLAGLAILGGAKQSNGSPQSVSGIEQFESRSFETEPAKDRFKGAEAGGVF